MDITITASGSRSAATAAVREQVKQLRDTPYKQSRALLSSLGDELTRRIAESDEPVGITATLKIDASRAKSAAPAADASSSMLAAARTSAADPVGSVTVGSKQ